MLTTVYTSANGSTSLMSSCETAHSQDKSLLRTVLERLAATTMIAHYVWQITLQILAETMTIAFQYLRAKHSDYLLLSSRDPTAPQRGVR